jgi:glucokinase
VGCIDIGGTKIAASVAVEGSMRGRVSEATLKQGSRDALARQVIDLLGRSCEQAGVPPASLAAVGVASCGPFVLHEGLIELAAPNICGGLARKIRAEALSRKAAGFEGQGTQEVQRPDGTRAGLPNDWISVPLEEPLRQAFANVRIENDGIAALEAERRWGALQGFEHCAYVTWSTGVGVGLCVDGRALRGKHRNAGHAGHMFVSDNSDALCGCGNLGDLEALVAGSAIATRFGSQGYADAATLMIAASAGDARAVAIIDELCRVMGRALYNLVVTLDLQCISLGGSVFWHHQDYLLSRLQSQISGKLPALTAGVSLVPAGLGNSVGDYAALALVA